MYLWHHNTSSVVLLSVLFLRKFIISWCLYWFMRNPTLHSTGMTTYKHFAFFVSLSLLSMAKFNVHFRDNLNFINYLFISKLFLLFCFLSTEQSNIRQRWRSTILFILCVFYVSFTITWIIVEISHTHIYMFIPISLRLRVNTLFCKSTMEMKHSSTYVLHSFLVLPSK